MADVVESQGGVGDEEWVKVGEREELEKADMFRYRFIICGMPTNCCIVYGITNDLYRVQDEHRVRWSEGYVEYIEGKLLRDIAVTWLRERGGI